MENKCRWPGFPSTFQELYEGRVDEYMNTLANEHNHVLLQKLYAVYTSA